MREQGRIQDLGLEGAKSSAEGGRIEAPEAPRVYGWGMGRDAGPSYLF